MIVEIDVLVPAADDGSGLKSAAGDQADFEIDSFGIFKVTEVNPADLADLHVDKAHCEFEPGN
jgi:hypothetical protein